MQSTAASNSLDGQRSVSQRHSGGGRERERERDENEEGREEEELAMEWMEE